MPDSVQVPKLFLTIPPVVLPTILPSEPFPAPRSDKANVAPDIVPAWVILISP